MKVRAGLAITVAAFVIGGCGSAQRQTPASSDPGPGSGSPAVAIDASCDDVVAHVKVLSINASGATTEEQKDRAAREVELLLTDLAEECEGGNGAAGWSPTFRGCVLKATSREDVSLCDKINANATPPAPPPAAGEDMGGMSCEVYVDRWVARHPDAAANIEMWRSVIEEQCPQLTRFEKECLSSARTAQDEVTCWEQSKKRP